MQQPTRPRTRSSQEEADARQVTRQRGVAVMLSVAGTIFLVLVAFLTSMLILNPLLELYHLEQDRDQAQEEYRRAKAEETQAANQFHWMMDPEYFEQMARDRANQAKDGETVIHRAAPERPVPAAPPTAPRRN